MHAPVERHEHEAQWGPAMRALPNDKQRRFVAAMFEVPQNRNTRIAAALAAGYGGTGTSTKTPKNKILGVIAGRLIHDEKVRAAIEEYGRGRLPALYPVALAALEKLLRDPKHRGHEKAVMGVIEKMSPIEFMHKHDHEHHHVIDHQAAALDGLRVMKQMGVPIEGLIKMFGINSLPQYEQLLAEKENREPDRMIMERCSSLPNRDTIDVKAIEIYPNQTSGE